MLPGCSIVTISLSPSSLGMKDSIEISESLPVKDTPSSDATILIPVKMGIVVLDETAFNTSWTLSTRRSFES